MKAEVMHGSNATAYKRPYPQKVTKYHVMCKVSAEGSLCQRENSNESCLRCVAGMNPQGISRKVFQS